jgi:4-aminobutyrate aminotransferase-like enzyme
LMLGIELVRDRASKEPAAGEAARIRAFCREAGVLIGVGGQFGNVLRLQPPLVITRAQLAHALDVLAQALASCR